MKVDEEAIGEWLARNETGSEIPGDTPDETGTKPAPGMGFAPPHANLRSFFDQLHAEKSVTAQRRSMMDDYLAQQMQPQQAPVG